MEFRQVKDFCKHAGAGALCPDNYKHCNADNCPLAIQNIIDEQDCERYCPIVDKYRADIRQFKTDYINAKEALKQLEVSYRERAQQFEQLETELKTNIDASMDFITSALFDLKDKLKTNLKRLEP